MKPKEYVQCKICGKNYVGILPTGGDGSVLFPRLHFAASIPITTSLGIMLTKYPGNKEYCAGSYMPGISKDGEE